MEPGITIATYQSVADLDPQARRELVARRHRLNGSRRSGNSRLANATALCAITSVPHVARGLPRGRC